MNIVVTFKYRSCGSPNFKYKTDTIFVEDDSIKEEAIMQIRYEFFKFYDTPSLTEAYFSTSFNGETIEKNIY